MGETGGQTTHACVHCLPSCSLVQIPAFSSSYFYIFYEQFLDIANQYILMLVFTLLAIFIVTLIFMGFKTAIIVCFCVLMIHLDMLVGEGRGLGGVKG